MGGIQLSAPSRQLARQLRKEIREGKYAPAERLPSTVKLAEQYSTSRSIMRNALDMLTAEGVLISRNGDGHYVAPGEPSEDQTLRDKAMTTVLFCGISVDEIARRSNASRWTIARMLSGIRPMTIEWAFMIIQTCEAYEREQGRKDPAE